MGRGIHGTDGDDVIHAIADTNGQIHLFANGGNDIIRMDFSGDFSGADPGDVVNGHHIYGGAGADEFRFENISNVINEGVRVVGRIDDLNVSEDTIWVEDTKVDLNNLPEKVQLDDGTAVTVRIVEYEIQDPLGNAPLDPQQFLLIGDNIMYAIEGARLDSTSPTGEEKHFFDWTEDPDDLKAVEFKDQINYVPSGAYDPMDIDEVYDLGRSTFTGSNGNDMIYFNKLGSGDGNQIFGAGGNDVINAGQGNDSVDGGAGDDLIAGGLDNDLLLGRSGYDRLWGGSGEDTLHGGTGNDTLHGGAGADLMIGGVGDDTYYVDHAGDTVRERPDQGHDQVISSVSFSLRNHSQHLEELKLTGNANAFAVGNSQDNRIVGNSGDNVLNGAWGNDTLIGGEGDDTFRDNHGKDLMIGGAGNDTYYVDHAGDTVRERPDQGHDQVLSSVSFSLRSHSQHLEELKLTGNANAFAVGNSHDNRIVGNSGDNLLNGAWGDDTLIGGEGDDTFRDNHGKDLMIGGAGNDTYYVDHAGDTVRERPDQGHDQVLSSVSFSLRSHSQHLEELKLTGNANAFAVGNSQDNRIVGNSGDNLLNGAWGDDTLIGGEGDDTFRDDYGDDLMIGGAGSDTFVFRGNFGQDTISDFDGSGDGDVIDLRALSDIVNFSDLISDHANQIGHDLVIEDGSGNTVTLTGINASNLSADDFLFG